MQTQGASPPLLGGRIGHDCCIYGDVILAIALMLLQDSPKLKQHQAEYDKMKTYLLKNYGNASFMEKMAIGLLALADGGHPDVVQQTIEEAKKAKPAIGTFKHSNWYIGFAGIFLSQVYIRIPSDEVKAELEGLLERAAQEQEPTGGWFCKKGYAKERQPPYPAQDHGQLTSMVYSTLLIMKHHGMRTPARSLELAEAYMQRQCGAAGILYGTGNNHADSTGSRGGFALLGLTYIKRSDHKVCTTYRTLYPQCFGRLHTGHHIGGWHFMGCVVGCWAMGPEMIGQLRAAALPRYLPKIDAEGGFYIGDDGASGGEKGLLGHNYCSTAALAMLVLFQNRDAFKIPKPDPKKPGGSASPFSNKK